jgi:uncharacterized protein YecT (DUF1311 family)
MKPLIPGHLLWKRKCVELEATKGLECCRNKFQFQIQRVPINLDCFYARTNCFDQELKKTYYYTDRLRVRRPRSPNE